MSLLHHVVGPSVEPPGLRVLPFAGPPNLARRQVMVFTGVSVAIADVAGVDHEGCLVVEDLEAA